MKKVIMLICLLGLWGCVAGNFPEKRNRLHEMNSDKEICEKIPTAVSAGSLGNRRIRKM